MVPDFSPPLGYLERISFTRRVFSGVKSKGVEALFLGGVNVDTSPSSSQQRGGGGEGPPHHQRGQGSGAPKTKHLCWLVCVTTQKKSFFFTMLTWISRYDGIQEAVKSFKNPNLKIRSSIGEESEIFDFRFFVNFVEIAPKSHGNSDF